MKHHDHTLRIIGGNWRGRKITFPALDEIRPTGDRLRETLFNWLMPDIQGASCLDLFAGSGVLGFEALSRGAASVTLVEQNPAIARSIADNLGKLEADRSRWTVTVSDARQWLAQQTGQYDLAFIDPPFAGQDIPALLGRIAEKRLVRRYVYVETGSRLNPSLLPEGWLLHRQKKSGAVHYALCRPDAAVCQS